MFAAASEPLLSNKNPPRKFGNKKEAEDFIDSLASDDTPLSTLASELKRGKKVTGAAANVLNAGSPSAKETLSKALVDEEIVVFKEDVSPPKQNADSVLESAVGIPGNRAVELAPESTANKKINVTPKIEVEYLIVLLDRAIDQKNVKDDEKAKYNATAIELSIGQDVSPPTFDEGAKLSVSGAGKVELFENESLTRPFKTSKVIPKESLTGGSKLKVWAKGKAVGKLTLELTAEASSNGDFVIKPPATQELGVVELRLDVYEHDHAALDKVTVSPDLDPIEDYYKNLEKEKIPDQVVLTDDDKVNRGRLIHVQNGDNFGRAKIVCTKLETANVPAGCGDYDVVLDIKNTSGDVAMFDKEEKGSKLNFPIKVKLKDLLSAEKEFWLEGTTACKKAGDAVLDIGLDRVSGGLAKTAKRNGDFASFTPVKIENVSVEYTPSRGAAVAWDVTAKRYYINFKASPDGRKVIIKAKLSEKIADVDIHFMLAPDANNRTTANWGAKGLPDTWKWDKIDSKVKREDKDSWDKFLHLVEKTDSNGEAKKELMLSQFGGDIFTPACYIGEDPHLAKYVTAYPSLAKRKPVVSKDAIHVWRKFWYQLIKVEGITVPSLAPSSLQYDAVKSDMAQASDLAITRKAVDKFSPQAIYPEYMVRLNGGTSDVLVVSDTNKGQFFTKYKAESDKPIKIPLLVCDAQWDAGGNSSPVTTNDTASNFPLDVTTSLLAIDPPLQGGDSFVSGDWAAAEKVSGSWTNVRSGNLKKSDITISKTRSNLRQVTINVPAALTGVTAGTDIEIKNLIIRGADGPYLGESFNQRILAVYNPKGSKLEKDDFQNTIVHEIGHAFSQVVKGNPAGGITGIPAHPDQKDLGQGNHCRHLVNKCVMYDSGPVAGSLNKYCDICHPYLLVQDMSSIR